MLVCRRGKELVLVDDWLKGLCVANDIITLQSDRKFSNFFYSGKNNLQNVKMDLFLG